MPPVNGRRQLSSIEAVADLVGQGTGTCDAGMVAGIVVGVVVALAICTGIARREGYSGVGGNSIVRCSKGHLYITIWVPGASFNSIRLGAARYQRCPVGHHWAIVRLVKDPDLTDEERAFAAEHKDLRIP